MLCWILILIAQTLVSMECIEALTPMWFVIVPYFVVGWLGWPPMNCAKFKWHAFRSHRLHHQVHTWNSISSPIALARTQTLSKDQHKCAGKCATRARAKRSLTIGFVFISSASHRHDRRAAKQWLSEHMFGGSELCKRSRDVPICKLCTTRA